MASKVDSPWDSVVSRFMLDYGYTSEAMHDDIVALLAQAYRKGRADGAQSEREWPHREDMGR